MVHEYAGEPVADSFVEEYCGYRGVHAAAEAEDYPVVAELFLECGNGGFDKRCRAPCARRAADAYREVAEQLHAACAVENLRVELHAPQPHSGLARERREAHVGGRSHCREAFRQGSDGVAVAHPYLRSGLDAVEQRAGRVDICEVGPAILARRGRLYRAAVLKGGELRAIAYA